MTPLTNSERQKRYILKKKLENNNEYILKNRLNAKKYYYNKIKKETINIDNNDNEIIIEKLEPIPKRLNPINKSILREETIQNYINIFKIIYKKYYNEDIDNNELEKILRNQ